MAGQEFARKTKISKSKDGDTFNPDKILERHCADAVRLWTAGVSLGSDTIFDDGAIQEANKFLNKLWNASRFALMSLEGFTPKTPHITVNAEDHWIRGRLKQVIDNYHRALDDFELHRAKVELDKFFWMAFCDNYIEFVKCRTQEGASEDERQSAFQTVYDVLLSLLKLFAPYAPHVTEEIYQLYFKPFEKSESLHLLPLPPALPLTSDETKSLVSGEFIVAAIGGVRSYKSKNQIGFKVPAEKLEILSTEEGLLHLKRAERVIKNFASSTSIQFSSILDAKAAPSDAFATERPDTFVRLNYRAEALKPKAS